MKHSSNERAALELWVALARSRLETAEKALEAHDLAGRLEKTRAELEKLRKTSIEVPEWLRRQAPSLAKVLRIAQSDEGLRRKLLAEAGGPCCMMGWALALERTQEEATVNGG